MALCDFLIVGAMKAGTTSVYNDLIKHPEIFMPEQKEPELLLWQDRTDAQVADTYRSLMKGAAPGMRTGEASTGYTKMPESEGCAQRALRVLGPDVKILYFERDPIARAISHYRHDFVAGTQHSPIDEALRTDPRYINYSRYDWQIAPWIEAYGAENVLRLKFEDYVSDRDTVLAQALTHIGVDPGLLVLDEAKVHNSSTDKYVEVGLRKRLVESRLFQFYIKPLFPRSVRQALIPLVLQKARPSEKEIADNTRSFLLEQLSIRP